METLGNTPTSGGAPNADLICLRSNTGAAAVTKHSKPRVYRGLPQTLHETHLRESTHAAEQSSSTHDPATKRPLQNPSTAACNTLLAEPVDCHTCRLSCRRNLKTAYLLYLRPRHLFLP